MHYTTRRFLPVRILWRKPYTLRKRTPASVFTTRMPLEAMNLRRQMITPIMQWCAQSRPKNRETGGSETASSGVMLPPFLTSHADDLDAPTYHFKEREGCRKWYFSRKFYRKRRAFHTRGRIVEHFEHRHCCTSRRCVADVHRDRRRSSIDRLRL